MTLHLIAAVARNRAIGLDNRLLYWLPNDLKRFKQLTTGHTIIMGRCTYDSLPHGALPHRRNIVISRRPGARFAGCDTYSSLTEALDHCAADEHVFIIGGASVYREACPLATGMELTEVHATPAQADVYFPKLDMRQWTETARESHPADEKNEQPFDFVSYRRKTAEEQ